MLYKCATCRHTHSTGLDRMKIDEPCVLRRSRGLIFYTAHLIKNSSYRDAKCSSSLASFQKGVIDKHHWPCRAYEPSVRSCRPCLGCFNRSSYFLYNSDASCGSCRIPSSEGAAVKTSNLEFANVC